MPSPAFLLPPGLPIPPRRPRPHHPQCVSSPTPPTTSARSTLLSLLSVSPSTRTGNDILIASLVSHLESSCVTPPSAADARLLGVWRNLHTTIPATSSAIQRFVVSNAALAPAVEQVLVGTPAGTPKRLVNRVDLRPALGAVLNVAASVEEVKGSRLSVRFDDAWFAVDRLPKWMGGVRVRWRVPYPVPFRLLGEKARGWLDVTYLDEQVRIARGSRGSAFVLLKRDFHLDAEQLDEYLESWQD